MKYSKIVLAGGTGYLGKVLTGYFRDKSEEIVILSRKAAGTDGRVKSVVWDGKTEGDWIKELEGAEVLVNLCGKNVNCRYTEANKKEIVESRTIPTTLLANVINKLNNPPQVWINVTSATIYRHADDSPQDEMNGEIGDGFSVDVCRKWEESFKAVKNPSTRKVALRMGIVLGREDGVIPRLLNLVRTGMGGKQGSGNQMMAWVHELDVARIAEWLVDHPIEGAVNCVAPAPVSNAEFMRLMRKAQGIPFGFPMPRWLLQIGALIIGTETELILKSRWVMPTRLLESGYQFAFPDAEQALKDILRKK
ncbi:MAG TPA: TIGR01777 family oxidoreductase [Parasegetibacter sp.]